MKRSAGLSAAAVCLLFFGLNIFTFAQNVFLMTPEGIGNLKIGMTVAEARKALPFYRFSRASDGEGIALIEVKRSGRTHFYMYANEFDPVQPIDETARIVFIEVVDPTYRTEQGVRVNMLLSDVERQYGKLQSIVLSEIESREYARFENQPLGIDLKVLGRGGQAGVYPAGETRTGQYSRNSYVGSVILLGKVDVISTDGGDGEDDGDETDAPVETGFASRYTDLGTQCQTPAGQGGQGGRVSTYCQGYGGYRIHIFDTATTMEINIQSEDQSKSVPVASQSLGFDMRNKQIEWRFRDGKPFAVIMRADEYRRGRDGLIRYPASKTGEILVVKGLPGFEQIDYKIDPRTTLNENEKARQMADAGYSAPNTTPKNFENLDIAQYNRLIINANRQRQAWVKSPTETGVRLAGEFTEMRNRTMEFRYAAPEKYDAVTLTVTDEGLLDDSLRAERIVFELTKGTNGVWTVTSAQKSWACQTGRGHQDFSAAPCN